VRELKLDPGRSRDYLNLMAEQSKRMQHHRGSADALHARIRCGAARDERVERRAPASRIRARQSRSRQGGSGSRWTPSRGSTSWGRNPRSQRVRQLASNAGVRYTPPGGEVRLIWRSSQEGAEFTVRRHRRGHRGRAHPPPDERFYRVDRAARGKREEPVSRWRSSTRPRVASGDARDREHARNGERFTRDFRRAACFRRERARPTTPCTEGAGRVVVRKPIVFPQSS